MQLKVYPSLAEEYWNIIYFLKPLIINKPYYVNSICANVE